jgi:hypothetical protein
MMGMPLSYMMKPVSVFEFVSDIEKIAYILVEEGYLMIGSRPRAYCVDHDRYSAFCPIPEQLATRFDVLIIKDTAGDVV